MKKLLQIKRDGALFSYRLVAPFQHANAKLILLDWQQGESDYYATILKAARLFRFDNVQSF